MGLVMEEVASRREGVERRGGEMEKAVRRGKERLREVRELCGGEGRRIRLLAEEVKNTLGVELMAGQQA